MTKLNGAYYGPSIPPPSSSTTTTYYRPSRRGDGGGGCDFCCCNPFTCCCKCIFNCICTCICQIVITLLVVLAIVAFVCWLIFRPNTVKFYATKAELSQFNLSSTVFPNNDNNNLTLRYDLTVNFTIRNPNQRIGIYYDRIEAIAFYQGQRFSTVDLQPFFQGHKSTSDVSAVFKGQNVVVLGGKEMGKYDEERSSGVYNVDVKLYLRVRLKFLFVKSSTVKPKIDCDLNVPLSSSNGGNQTTSPSSYESKRCDFVW